MAALAQWLSQEGGGGLEMVGFKRAVLADCVQWQKGVDVEKKMD